MAFIEHVGILMALENQCSIFVAHNSSFITQYDAQVWLCGMQILKLS